MLRIMSRLPRAGSPCHLARCRLTTFGRGLTVLSVVCTSNAAPVTDPISEVAGESPSEFRIVSAIPQPAAAVIEAALAPSEIGESLSILEAIDSPTPPSDPATPETGDDPRPTLTRESAMALARLLIDPAPGTARRANEQPTAHSTESWHVAAVGPSFDRGPAPSSYGRAPEPRPTASSSDSPGTEPEWAWSLRQTLDFLREKRQWILATGVVIALISVIGSSVSRRNRRRAARSSAARV